MKPYAIAVFLSLAIASPAYADVGVASREVTLPVELKDPFVAYSLGLVPFYSMAAANYVGFSRLSGTCEPGAASTGFGQFALDVGLVVAGSWLMAQGGANAAQSAQAAPLLGGACYLAIPVAHMFLFAPGWGNRAAMFNRASIELAGYGKESVTIPRPASFERE